MSAENVIGRIERARELLEGGELTAALRTLPKSAPAALREEIDFIAAEAWRGRGFFSRAEARYDRVLRETPKQDPILWIDSALGSASCMRSLGLIDRARRRIRDASDAAAIRGLRMFREKIYLEDALIDRAAGKYGKSLRKLEIFRKRYLRDGKWAEAAFILWAEGGALRFNGNLKPSLKAFERSLQLARRAKDPVGQGYALFGLGGITRILGRLEAAAGFYREAKRLFDGTDDVFAKAYAHCGYANALRQLGRLKEAKSHYEASHRLYSQLDDRVDLAYVEWGLGKIALHSGELKLAQKRLEASFRLFHEFKETRGEVLALAAMAQASHAMGRSADAERLFADAYAIARRHKIHAHLEVFT